VTQVLLACARVQLAAGAVLEVSLREDPTRVGLHLGLALPASAAAVVRPLIEPLGGSLEGSAQETTLWLPRA